MPYDNATGRIETSDDSLTGFARLARGPAIKQVAAMLSQVAAGNRQALSGPARRLHRLKIVVVVAFCIGLALAPRLWIGPRSFPMVPLVDDLPTIDGLLAEVLYASLFILAAAIIVSAKPQRAIAAFLAVVGVFCVADQTRWQPWVFLYWFLLVTLALFSWDSRDDAGRRSALNLCRLVIACTYIFSGLQKTNLNFVDIDFPWIVSPITNLAPATAGPLRAFAFLVPPVQVAFGVGLLTNRYRHISLWAAVSMHAFILAMFGPLGLDWNYIVWPWTAAMAVFDVLLFTGGERYARGDFLSVRERPYHALVLVVFVLLPALSFFNLWDSFLSAALYSGNLDEGTIYLSDAGRASLPPALAAHAMRASEDTNVLNLQRWAIGEISVMPYPEARVYRAVAKRVCDQMSDRRQLVLIVREQRMFRSRPETNLRCWDL